ncbi:ankyrin repeat protein [Talaromyces stipitatus ATCC 10500]|uniref:Ankyrin repeat protein n=1 Tax=Talaromyces stipitatus (strain ATCC 10500 / CBS 375.48 / QM 6759 / NRRL 1006) TaxID=441959 RepID=B8M830_TALSN|nr:ankyrin repeat protein [Talaromyces stipitatus ATCC 10500]EED19992.1 ankyrin repeat protein [Talaromyces stipitatus ATCC 10500]
MADDEGASPRELVVEACRRDQPHLIEQVLDSMNEKTNEEVAEFFNNVKDALGNYALHICAMYGSYDVMDMLFDIQYFECDPLTRIDNDTPLHVAVRYANEKDHDAGLAMIEMMCEAGCDPRVRNKHGQKPISLVDPRHTDIKAALQKAEYILNENIQHEQEAEGGEGSASDSD